MLASTRVATIAVHAYIGQRMRWQGTLAVFTPETALHPSSSALYLTDVVDINGVCVWTAVWLRYTECLSQLDLRVGERVRFVARVDRQLDGTYTLSRPSHYERVVGAR